MSAKFPELHPDAPPVPAGLQPCPGVEYGCGDPKCTACYELGAAQTLAEEIAAARPDSDTRHREGGER
jgi:hypothetical protein